LPWPWSDGFQGDGPPQLGDATAKTAIAKGYCCVQNVWQ